MRIVLCVFMLLLGGAKVLFGQMPDTAFWIPNGPVNAMVSQNNRLIVGGLFDQISPATGTFIALDSATAQVQYPFPKVNGKINSIISDGQGGLYVGGEFSQVGPYSISYLFHLLANGQIDQNFLPTPDGPIYALLMNGPTLLVAGNFTTILSEQRKWACGIDSLGVLTDWEPNTDGPIYAMAIDQIDNYIYIGGDFQYVGVDLRIRIAKVDSTYGHPIGWPGPYSVWRVQPPDQPVRTIVPYLNKVYLGGDFTVLGGYPRTGLAALDQYTGDVDAFDANVVGKVYSIVAQGGELFLGGKFTSVAGYGRSNLASISILNVLQSWNPAADNTVYCIVPYNNTILAGGDFQRIGLDSISRLARIDNNTGQALAWNPMINGRVNAILSQQGRIIAGGEFTGAGGVLRSNLFSYDLSTKQPDNWKPIPNGEIFSMALTNDTLYLAGNFSLVNGQFRQRMAAIDVNTNQTFAFNPNCDNLVRTMVIDGPRLFLGGNFSVIGNQPRENIASINRFSGQVESWNPVCAGTVNQLLVLGNDVYVAGFYSAIGNQPRANLARIDAFSGLAAFNWSCDANDGIYDMHLFGDKLVVGGWFTQIGNTARNRIALVDTASAQVDVSFNPGANQFVRDIAIQGDDFFVSGYFNSFGGQPRQRLGVYDYGNQAVDSWSPALSEQAQTMIATPTQLFCGGRFLYAGGTLHPNFAVFDIQYVTSIPQQKANEPFLIYPNPASNFLTIQTSAAFANGVFKIYDLQGREVGLPVQLNGMQQTLDCSYLADGTYIMTIVTPTGLIQSSRIIITR
ncbi:MAG: T9SS type A sorting domain-containing protein [Bacteroidia bacterium]